MEFNAASESLYAHSGGENGVLNKFSSFFDTSAEEGGVKVWEPNERGNQSRTQTNFCPTYLGVNPQHTVSVSSSPSDRLGDSPLEFEGEQQDSSQWLTVSSEMLQREVVITVH